MNKMNFSVLCICILLAGCQPAGPAPLTDQDRAAIEATTTAFENAVRKADWDAAAATYTEDGILLPPFTDAVTGRAAIRNYLMTFPPIVRFELENVEIRGSGDLAVVRGTFAMTLQPEGMPPIEDHGKFIDTRKKQADGSWLYHWDMFNSSVAPPAATP